MTRKKKERKKRKFKGKLERKLIILKSRYALPLDYVTMETPLFVSKYRTTTKSVRPIYPDHIDGAALQKSILFFFRVCDNSL
jgi:hypothetical protein